jgi:hypothetical protein
MELVAQLGAKVHVSPSINRSIVAPAITTYRAHAHQLVIQTFSKTFAPRLTVMLMMIRRALLHVLPGQTISLPSVRT